MQQTRICSKPQTVKPHPTCSQLQLKGFYKYFCLPLCHVLLHSARSLAHNYSVVVVEYVCTYYVLLQRSLVGLPTDLSPGMDTASCAIFPDKHRMMARTGIVCHYSYYPTNVRIALYILFGVVFVAYYLVVRLPSGTFGSSLCPSIIERRLSAGRSRR